MKFKLLILALNEKISKNGINIKVFVHVMMNTDKIIERASYMNILSLYSVVVLQAEQGVKQIKYLSI